MKTQMWLVEESRTTILLSTQTFDFHTSKLQMNFKQAEFL